MLAFKSKICSELGEVFMTAARAIVTKVAALFLGLAAWATPASANVIEFTLGSEPTVDLTNYAYAIGNPRSFSVTARLNSSTAQWFQDVTKSREFPEAVLTRTSARTIITFDFSDVVAASVMEFTDRQTPYIELTFDFRTLSSNISSIPEPSTWAMLLIGGVALGGRWASRRRPTSFA
jgi:hypothetical protein